MAGLSITHLCRGLLLKYAEFTGLFSHDVIEGNAVFHARRLHSFAGILHQIHLSGFHAKFLGGKTFSNCIKLMLLRTGHKRTVARFQSDAAIFDNIVNH